MNVEIFRPIGIYAITSGTSPGEQKKLPVLAMSAGRIITGLDGSIVESIVALEIHGERMAVHLPVRVAEGSRGLIEWDNWSLSLSIYSRWVSGLSLDQKEAMIGEVIRWEEGVEEEIHAQNDAYQEIESYDIEKLKAS